MKDRFQIMRTVVLMAWRVSPSRTLGSLLEVVGRFSGPLTGVWVGLLIQSAQKGDPVLAVWAAIALCATQTASVLGSTIGMTMRLRLAEQVGIALDRRLIDSVAHVSSIDYTYDSNIMDRLEVVEQNRGHLGGVFNMMVITLTRVVTSVAAVIVLVWANPILLALVAMSLASVGISRRIRRARQAATRQAASGSRNARHLFETAIDPEAVADIQQAGSQKWLVQQWSIPYRRSQQLLVGAARRAMMLTTLRDLGLVALYGVIMLALLLMFGFGFVSLAGVTAVLFAGRSIFSMLTGPEGMARRLGAMMDTVEQLEFCVAWSHVAMSKVVDEVVVSGTLILDGVSYAYPGCQQEALQDINLRIDPGETVAIVGENGAGKSTLVDIMSGLLTPSSGTVHLGKIRAATAPWNAGDRAGVFQACLRPEFVLGEAVAIGDVSVPREEVGPSVIRAFVSIGSVLPESLPGNVETQLGSSWEGGVGLSGGQWQEVANARGRMAAAPVVRVVDEPTSASDAFTERRIFDAYARDRQASITVLVTHRFSTVGIADRILVLERGRITADGNHSSLMAENGLYADLFRLQASGYVDVQSSVVE